LRWLHFKTKGSHATAKLDGDGPVCGEAKPAINDFDEVAETPPEIAVQLLAFLAL
jgi:hypothetical protein